MITDTEIRVKGFAILTQHLGVVEAERFVALSQREPFDYTVWQRELWKDDAIETISQNAMAFRHNQQNSLATPNDLFDSRFEHVGRCLLDDTLKSGVRFQIDHYAAERVVYAFVVEKTIKYIGICESPHTTLRQRMNRYQGMQGAGTNERITTAIKALLEQQRIVNIFAWQPKQQLSLGDLQIDLIKGAENPLIHSLQPEWNTRK